MAVAVVQKDGRAVPSQDITQVWKTRIELARKDRARYEPAWALARAFAAGKHHLKWSRRQRKLVLPPERKGRERYAVEEIGQYRLTAVGELSHDDELPTLLFRQGEITSEEYAKQANDALAYAWDEELNADEVLMDLKFAFVDLGTAAVRCRWDPTAGPVAGHLPAGPDGKPVKDEQVLAHLEQNGQMPDGSLPRYKQVREGASRWEIGAPENLLVPPGIEYGRDFPWEIWARPVAITDLVEQYGAVAAGLKPEELSALQMLGSREMGETTADPDSDPGTPGKLHDHVLVYTCYERATTKKPDGEMMVLAGSDDLIPLETARPLPYKAPDGTPRSGISYFHYTRLPGRFWGRGLIEVLKDPQRMIDRRRMQIGETLDRGQPKTFVEKGSLEGDLGDGAPLDILEFKQGTPLPNFHPGVAPGPWMQAEVESCREDMARASGIQAVTLGENPTNVGTYSQLALLREADQTKRVPMLKSYQSGKQRLVEDTLYDIRTYWGSSKQITVAGADEGLLQSAVFDATKIPPFFKVQIAKGSSKPLTQGAKLQLIKDTWDAAVASGAAVHNPTGWMQWLSDSYDAGDKLPIPGEDSTAQADVAKYENHLMLTEGVTPDPEPHDQQIIHVPIHRHAFDQARASGNKEAAARIQMHLTASIQAVVTARKAWQYPDPNDTTDQASVYALDEDHALRENELLLQGAPLNRDELTKAFQSVSQGVNPDTGQPLQSPGEAQSLLQNAALKPTVAENLQVHMERHGNLIKAAVFPTLPPETQQRILTHYNLTRQLWMSLPMLPDKMTPPRVSLQLREDVGPSTVAAVLNRAGVPEADAHTIAAEPPMPNQVNEDVTPPGQKPPDQQPDQHP